MAINALKVNGNDKIITPLKLLTQEKITQTNGANNEHKHSSKYYIEKLQNLKCLLIISIKHMHYSLDI